MCSRRIKRWHEISSNPNSNDVLEFRKRQLAAVRRNELISNRAEYFCVLANGLNVLDVGVVEHFMESSANDDWLHGRICAHAKSCLGVDILEEEVSALTKRGFNVIVWDVAEKAIPRKFDLIIVGDVVEHIENPTALFNNLSEMLQPNGRIVLSTPNPWYANVVIRNLREGMPFTDSADHIGWFDAGTLCEIANRSGLILDRYSGVKTEGARTLVGTIFFKLSPILIRLGFRPEFFSKTMVYEFVLAS